MQSFSTSQKKYINFNTYINNKSKLMKIKLTKKEKKSWLNLMRYTRICCPVATIVSPRANTNGEQ